MLSYQIINYYELINKELIEFNKKHPELLKEDYAIECENDQKAIYKKLIIDKKLYDNFVNNNDYTIKAHIIREIQRMVQVVEGRNIDSRLKNIERIRQEGFPMSLTEDRMLTEKEIADNFADMYEARVVEKRQVLKNLIKNDFRENQETLGKQITFYPHFNYDKILL